jgi:hypothetical protein
VVHAIILPNLLLSEAQNLLKPKIFFDSIDASRDP